MQCKCCWIEFKGRAHRAHCHLIGKAGEGVAACKLISEQRKLDFIAKVFPELLSSPTEVTAEGPPLKKQQTMASFVTKQNFDLVDSEIAKFVYTSGVSFNVLRNPHLQRAFSLLTSSYTIPSDLRLKGPLPEGQEKDIQEWKTEKLSSGLVCLTGDGWTNNRRVGCLNLEAITDQGPIHYDTFERTAQVTEVDAPYIAGIFNDAIKALGGADKVVGVGC